MKAAAHRRVALLISILSAIAAWIIIGGNAPESNLTARWATGQPQLISSEPLPDFSDGEMCEWEPASFAPQEQMEAFSTPADTNIKNSDADRAPVRVIRDNYPTYSAIAVDTNSNEVFLEDENLFGIKVFNRTDNTPPNAGFTEPKRILGGPLTKLEFNCALYVDPNNGDIYSVNNDTLDTMTVFPRDAKGNVKAMRTLHTPHRAYGVAVDEQAQELFLTVEHPPQIAVYRKNAGGDDKPIRRLEGEHTRLADAHGIALDTKNGWMFVSNHGASSGAWKKGGWFDPPSITVYPLKASGDTAPLRIIAGPKTQLNWPAHVYLDAEHSELFVANDVDDSILVFHETDEGDVAPARVLKGTKTGLKNPTSLFVDTKNNELFVSNMGNHTATAYSRAASGDTAPLRTIRSAPVGMPAQMIGNPGAVGYDTKREEILVPNCVAHPQIAVFARLAKQNSKPQRVLAGQTTLLSRTMHDIRYDATHDEIYVTNPFAQAILTFSGSAQGEEPPIRIIQGPHTLLDGQIDRLAEDPVHNEILIPDHDRILVFSRDGKGDVAPLRVISGPDTQVKDVGSIAVDPIHNVIVVGTNIDSTTAGPDAWVGGSLLVFNRMDNGNAKPIGVISGPKTGIVRMNQIEVQPTKGWIIATQPGKYGEAEPEGVFVGVWSIRDDGDVSPRWKIGGPKSTIKKPRGVAINPKNKELIVADMQLNAVLTYYFPEIF